MDPQARWEQAQINELEGFTLLEQLTLTQDKIQPSHQREAMQEILEEGQQKQQKQPI